jgi:type II restriction enzyme
MPFQVRLLGKDRLALFSFIHSLNTVFGTSIFEPVAKEIAEEHFKTVELQKIPETKISSEAQRAIQDIVDNLAAGFARPDKIVEIAKIRGVCQAGEIKSVKKTRIDLSLEKETGEMYFIDIKTANPNRSGFQDYKRMLLDWVGITLFVKPDAVIRTLICIPYNPYEPKEYSRWTMVGMLDVKEELMVGREFWDFLGGNGTYEEVLNCFERVGIEMRDEIDENFKKFQTTQ